MLEIALSCPDELEELRDLRFECAGLRFQFGRGIEHLARRRTGREAGFADLPDIGRHLIGRARSQIDAARQILPGDRLLVDRAGDRCGGGLEFLDLACDRPQRADAGTGRILHRADLVGDLFGRPAGLRGQFLHFAGDDGKPASGFAATRGLDRGIEREQIGALRDRLDELDDLADLATDELIARKREAPRRRNNAPADGPPMRRPSVREQDKGGVLGDYGLSEEQGNEIIMAARAHWFEDEEAPAPAETSDTQEAADADSTQ